MGVRMVGKGVVDAVDQPWKLLMAFIVRLVRSSSAYTVEGIRDR